MQPLTCAYNTQVHRTTIVSQYSSYNVENHLVRHFSALPTLRQACPKRMKDIDFTVYHHRVISKTGT